MGDYQFITDNITYSFSSVSSFNTCKYGFKLAYIDAEERENNAFAEYGTLIHSALEKYFKKELERKDLINYYKDNYDDFVKTNWPNYPAGMSDGYYNDGLSFFEYFQENNLYDRDLYDIIIIEGMVISEHFGFKLVVKPDLVLREKETGKTFLIDYKTSKLRGGKYDEKKINEYKKQFYLYSYFLYKEMEIEVNEIVVWFIRNMKEYKIKIDHSEVLSTLDWFENTIKEISEENIFLANNTKDNKYFCDNLCSFRSKCEFRR